MEGADKRLMDGLTCRYGVSRGMPLLIGTAAGLSKFIRAVVMEPGNQRQSFRCGQKPSGCSAAGVSAHQTSDLPGWRAPTVINRKICSERFPP